MARIERALISVSDKTGIGAFAGVLHHDFGIEIISTGKTAKALAEDGIPVTLVEEVTGLPEMMDGRVKTLHPAIMAGILADRDNRMHMEELSHAGFRPIDLVVVNLYPFFETITTPGCTLHQAIETIDIGGPTNLRAAAKNYASVAVVCDIKHYAMVLGEMRHNNGEIALKTRMFLAAHVFRTCAGYDTIVQSYLEEQLKRMRTAS